MSESKTIIRRPPAARASASCSSRSLSSRKTPKCFRTASFDPGVEGGPLLLQSSQQALFQQEQKLIRKGRFEQPVRGNLPGGERRPRVAAPVIQRFLQEPPFAADQHGMPPRSASFANSASGTRKYTATSPSVRTSYAAPPGPDCDSDTAIANPFPGEGCPRDRGLYNTPVIIRTTNRHHNACTLRRRTSG